jgi:hypothetical protein
MFFLIPAHPSTTEQGVAVMINYIIQSLITGMTQLLACNQSNAD